VFVTGYYNGTSFDSLRFGNTSFLCNASETGMFLVKYDSNGNILWAVNAVNNNTMQANSVTTDAAGNAYVTGFFTSGPLIFGTDTLRSLTSAMFLVKYNSSGNLIWALGGSDYTEAWSVTTDASNNVLVTGYFYNTTVLFGTITLTDLGLKNIYTVKYSPSGTILWAKHFGGTLIETANAITTDAANNAYVTGFFRDTVPIHFGPDTVFTPLLANSTTYYMYLLKYDSSGTEQWARTAGLINYTTQGFSVSCDASGVYVSGDFFGPHVVFGNDTLLFGGAAKAPLFLVKYDFNGHVQCATRLDAEDNNAVATDDFGNAYITGTFFTNSFVAGPDTLQTLSTSFVVAKYTCITSHEGVTELINNENIDMFPNPTTSTFNVSSSGTIESLKVYNILGDIIRNYELGIKNGGSATIDMSSYTTGLYFVEIKTGKGIVRKKLIKE
jgi:hypothetical protein